MHEFGFEVCLVLQGNQFFRDGQYVEAIEKYTKAIELDGRQAVYPANRAMALLKQEKSVFVQFSLSVT